MDNNNTGNRDKFLMANRDMFDKHPRKDGNSLRAVRVMKPFWSAGVGSYHWIEEPFLQQNQDWEDWSLGSMTVTATTIGSAIQIAAQSRRDKT
jgi:hypothetical protein